MFRLLKVKFFVSRLSYDECEKLYASLLMSRNDNISCNQALFKARFDSKREDLKHELLEILTYGPR
ncbi:hypothetical protein LFLT20_13900 [Limosilactobacillus fermentum]|nr:hypothetical protein LFLT20_13900 [Limosilactobacillus fermentum]